MRKLIGTLLLAAGVLTLAWVLVVWRWQDPFTALYTHVEQTRLGHAYTRRASVFAASTHSTRLAADAATYARTLQPGDPVGRLIIHRIGLNMVVVQGTGESSLEKGPGHYTASGLPGGGRLIYVAGHRTTYLAPFSAINDIRVGDTIRFDVPYGDFTYRVVRHYIVASNDVAVLRNTGQELLRLQACHPRFFATHRYIVDARLVSVTPAST